MTASMLALLVGAAIALLILAAWILDIRSRQRDEKWLPRELRNAELVYAEKLFRSGGDVPIIAKCDRGYRTKKGVIVLLELKTRRHDRVYPSDVIELSAQRYAISDQTSKAVAEHAYVLIQLEPCGALQLHRVKLLPPSDVVYFAIRRHMILSGAVVGNYARSDGLCTKCAFAKECRNIDRIH